MPLTPGKWHTCRHGCRSAELPDSPPGQAGARAAQVGPECGPGAEAATRVVPPFLPPVAWGKVHGLVPGLRNPLMRHVSTLAAVLADGALPLDVLEAKIERWIAAQKEG